MMTDINPGPEASITLNGKDGSVKVPLYSSEGVALLNTLRLKQAAEFKTMYEPNWLGMKIVQLPEDIVAMQELLWRLRPDVVVECGVAHGGSLILYASILELAGKGTVVGVDIEIRPHNRAAIEAHPLAHRIELIEGSSIDSATAAEVRRHCPAGSKVMVVLDSNHSREHVAREITLYKDLVTVGSYLVVMDGAQALVSDIPRGKPEWADDNPLAAVRRFLADNDEFECDVTFERFGSTCVPEGFLKRLRAPVRR
jgi:cephalosporin hydroxylase